MRFLLLVLFAFSLTGIALADVVQTVNPAGMEVTPDFLAYLFASMKGIQGAGVIGGAAIFVQLIIRALDQPFANRFFSQRSGLEKLAIVAGLTFAVTPLGLMSAGLPIGVALLHSSTLTAFSVLLNQIYSQALLAKKEKEDAEKPAVVEKPKDAA